MRRLTLAALIAAALAFVVPPPARAATTGGCTVILAGIDLTRAPTPQTAIPVSSDAAIEIRVTSPVAVTEHSTSIQVAGITWQLAHFLGGGTTFTDSIQIQSYSHVGSGLYRVIERTNSTQPCEASGFIRVSGPATAKIATWVGIILLLLGALALTIGITIRSSDRMAFRTQAWEEGSVRVRPRPAPLPLIGGLVAAPAALLVLQQFGVLYPTLLITVITVVAGGAVGIFVPWLVRVGYVRLAGFER